MRKLRRLEALALCLSIGGLAAFGVLYDATASAAPAATAASSGCQTLPVPSPSPSPTPSATASATASPTAAASTPAPTDLCVTVQASQDSIQAGQAATWSVQVFAQNGPVTGVSVTLTSSLAGSPATFTGRCPGGDGSSTCSVGDMGTDVTPSSYQMQAQIAVPSAAAGTVVTLTASANATPALPTLPSAATSVTITAAPTPSASASATKSAAPSPSGQPATTPAATVPSIGVLPTLPALAAPVTPQTQVAAISNPGSIGSLLPVITPAAYSTSPNAPTAGLVTAPAAETAASPGASAQATNASSFVLIVPTADAEKIGLAVLLVAVGLALGLRARGTFFARAISGGASRGAHSATSPNRPEPAASDKSDDSAEKTQG